MSHVEGVAGWVMGVWRCVSLQAGTAPPPMKHLKRQRSPWLSPRTCQPAPPTSRTTGGTKVRAASKPKHTRPPAQARVNEAQTDTSARLPHLKWVHPMKQQSKGAKNPLQSFSQRLFLKHPNQTRSIKWKCLDHMHSMYKYIKCVYNSILCTSSGGHLLYQISWKNEFKAAKKHI